MVSQSMIITIEINHFDFFFRFSFIALITLPIKGTRKPLRIKHKTKAQEKSAQKYFEEY